MNDACAVVLSEENKVVYPHLVVATIKGNWETAASEFAAATREATIFLLELNN